MKKAVTRLDLLGCLPVRSETKETTAVLSETKAEDGWSGAFMGSERSVREVTLTFEELTDGQAVALQHMLERVKVGVGLIFYRPAVPENSSDVYEQEPSMIGRLLSPPEIEFLGAEEARATLVLEEAL